MNDQQGKRAAGRPQEYPGRERTTIQLSRELLKAIDERRGKESRAIEIERQLRKAYGLPELTKSK